MDEKEIKRLLRQAGDSLQAIFDYFRLKNKVLWSSTTAWATGTKAIADISKYQTLIAFIDLGGAQMIMHRQNDTTFWGSVVVDYPTWFATFACTLTLSGNKATISNVYWLSHNQNSNHGAVKQTGGIKKIIGLDPILPATLQNIIGGGYCIIRKGGVLHEVVHLIKAYWAGYKVHLIRYIQPKNLQAKQGMEKSGEHDRDAQAITGWIHRIKRVCLFWRRAGESGHTDISIINHSDDALCGILQQPHICKRDDYVSCNHKAAIGVHRYFRGVRPITARGWIS